MTIMFDYTQSKFWGGPWYGYTSLTVISILGGFFGLDHLWLRSPLSGFLKFIVNVFTLGLWYFYDLLQIFGEKDFVMKNGLSAPFVGPLGIGAGMFIDSNPSANVAKAPYLFLLYMFLLWMPFGLDLYMAGDTQGALVKAICTIGIFPFVFPFIFAVLWGFVNIGRSVFTPKALFTTGTYHMWPTSLFIGENGPSVLGPVDVNGVDDKCPQPAGGILGSFLGPFLPIVAGLIPGLVPAASAVTTAVKVAANSASAAVATTEKGYETIVDSIVSPAAKMVGTGAALATTMATMPQLPMKGGSGSGSGSGGSGSGSSSSIALLGLFTVIIGGGALMAAKRMNLNELLFNKQRKDADDRPPEPRSL